MEKNNAKLYVLPEGWDAADKVAADLECGPDAVRRTMAPLIKAKAVESRQFVIWDSGLKRLVRTTAYHQVGS